MSLIEITANGNGNGNRDKILLSAEKFKNNFINNKIALKYYIKTNWLVQHAIRNELSLIICQMSNLTREQINFLHFCDFIECKKCKTYKTKNTHCKKCKVIKKANLIEIICPDDVCSICLDTLNNCVLTLCNHKFHKVCMYSVLMNKKECPLCREKISV